MLGDESGYSIGQAQQTKLAAIEAMWETEPAPAGFNIIAGINEAEQKNDWALQVPYVLGLIATRSVDTEILGIHDIKKLNADRIINGVTASGATLRAGMIDSRARFNPAQDSRNVCE